MKKEQKDVSETEEMTASKPHFKDLKADTTNLKKKEKNRVAAYKSRQKQTHRADTLHQEYEHLEKDNAALRKEIQKLQQEKAYLSKVLQQHENTCLLLSPDIIWELQKPPPLISPKEINQISFEFPT